MKSLFKIPNCIKTLWIDFDLRGIATEGRFYEIVCTLLNEDERECCMYCSEFSKDIWFFLPINVDVIDKIEKFFATRFIVFFDVTKPFIDDVLDIPDADLFSRTKIKINGIEIKLIFIQKQNDSFFLLVKTIGVTKHLLHLTRFM